MYKQIKKQLQGRMKHDKGMQAYSVYYAINTNAVLGSDCTKDHSKHTAHPILHKSKPTFFLLIGIAA